MIYTLIVEDEEPAASRLVRMLKSTGNEIEIAAITDTVESAVRWLEQNRHPDLIMLDIQLGDGLSFDIFKRVKVDSYVIFTTAYDEYAIRAFETNSIDYILKPVDEKRLAQSLEKYKRLSSAGSRLDVGKLIETLENRKERFKKRFVITVASKIKVVDTTQIAYFFSREKNTFVRTFDNRTYPLEYSLEHIEQIVDPELFFRINRQFMLAYRSIVRIDVYSKSRIKIQTEPGSEDELLVSTSRTSEFRNWLDR
jgi:DNA-binding LytR/AlgR family response regulator